MKDDYILDLYWNRDQKAIELTNEKYGNYCYTIANSILTNHEDSEETVLDTWMHTWNAIPPNRPGILKMFLAKITRNLSFDKYKKLHAAKRGGGELPLVLDELSECISGNDTASGHIEAEELAGIINDFVSNLPKRDGDIFIRRYFFLDTAAQIGKRYGLTQRNVLVILTRTRQKLYTLLQKEGYSL